MSPRDGRHCELAEHDCRPQSALAQRRLEHGRLAIPAINAHICLRLAIDAWKHA
jgi:hypothetical protein